MLPKAKSMAGHSNALGWAAQHAGNPQVGEFSCQPILWGGQALHWPQNGRHAEFSKSCSLDMPTMVVASFGIPSLGYWLGFKMHSLFYTGVRIREELKIQGGEVNT